MPVLAISFTAGGSAARAVLLEEAANLKAQADWLDQTIVGIIISEAQNEVADFRKWGFDIIPHRALMKQGFDSGDGKRVDVETAFKTPEHPFRVAIVCAMWLTGFDVESLSTLYIDKPMKAHTLMQAVARANPLGAHERCGIEAETPQMCFGRLDGFDERLHALLDRRNDFFTARAVVADRVLGERCAQARQHTVVIDDQTKILAGIDSS